jgi:hypothetical protein
MTGSKTDGDIAAAILHNENVDDRVYQQILRLQGSGKSRHAAHPATARRRV